MSKFYVLCARREGDDWIFPQVADRPIQFGQITDALSWITTLGAPVGIKCNFHYENYNPEDIHGFRDTIDRIKRPIRISERMVVAIRQRENATDARFLAGVYAVVWSDTNL